MSAGIVVEGSSTAQGGTPTCTTPGSASWNPGVAQLPSRRVDRSPTSVFDVSRRVGQLWFLTENTPTPSLVMKTRVSRLLREAKILLKAPLRGEDSATRCARAFFIRNDQATWRCWSVFKTTAARRHKPPHPGASRTRSESMLSAAAKSRRREGALGAVAATIASSDKRASDRSANFGDQLARGAFSGGDFDYENAPESPSDRKIFRCAGLDGRCHLAGH